MTLLWVTLYAMLVGEGVLIVVLIHACQLMRHSIRALEAMAEALDRQLVARWPR